MNNSSQYEYLTRFHPESSRISYVLIRAPMRHLCTWRRVGPIWPSHEPACVVQPERMHVSHTCSARLTRLGLAWITSKLFDSDPGQTGSGHSSRFELFEHILDNVSDDLFECNFNGSDLNSVRIAIPTVKLATPMDT